MRDHCTNGQPPLHPSIPIPTLCTHTTDPPTDAHATRIANECGRKNQHVSCVCAVCFVRLCFFCVCTVRCVGWSVLHTGRVERDADSRGQPASASVAQISLGGSAFNRPDKRQCDTSIHPHLVHIRKVHTHHRIHAHTCAHSTTFDIAVNAHFQQNGGNQQQL